MSMKHLKIKLIVLVTLLALVGLSLVPSVRVGVLTRVGRALVHADPVDSADAIVIAVDGSGPEVLEAADLVRSGLTQKVWVLAGPPDELGLEFARHGLPYADKSTVAVQTLRALGVKQAEIATPRVDGSNSEAEMLPAWIKSHQYKRIVFIVVADHSQRIRRMMNRVLATDATAPDIRIHYSRYAQFKPEDWWRARGGVRTVIVEYQKLILDVFSHPTGS
jgi:uncharacterized SAM-binding protein YcdF (DUF218 family)